ncbi:hypothetical protein GGD66_006446 [Bradyrhizobium sp. CIR48]|uniref:hypothetical protein n=1 Tax=Bradyrhizobium sp. CIR48 TaxID=2663840 RepID=UPI0016060461|nr:hypothetical protein [Bradyrhizobium sp. CIR48]MBB4427863.1 hypothetical protein [Bradyrhizobium sp. CIR48]
MTNTIPLTESSFATYLALATTASGTESFGPVPDIQAERRKEQDARLKEIRSLLFRLDSGLLLDAVSILRKPILIAALLGRVDPAQYAIINYIRDALAQPDDDHKDRHFIVPFDEEASWKQAISNARRAMELADFNHYDINRFSRAHAVADACMRWERRGFKVALSTFGPNLDGKDVSRICADIEATIQSIGGRNVINGILAWHTANGRIYEGSLLYGRVVDQLGQHREPSVPFHFLYNLALKHLNAAQTSRHPKDDFGQVIEFARDLGAVFDVESYVVYENMSVALGNFHHTLVDRIFWDELFGFQQWQPTVAEHLLKEWLGHVEAAGIPLPAIPLAKWRRIVSSLFKVSSVDKFVVTHPCEHVDAELGLAGVSHLFELLTITAEKLNDGYCTPFDTSKRNAPYFPLYRLSQEVWLIPPRAILGRAIYERVYALLRGGKNSQLERVMGAALELLTADAIASTGKAPEILGEQYKEGAARKSPTFEVDLASETDRDLILLECKKKPLTNAARAGNSLSAAVDLAQGFLDPLVQMARHEKHLYGSGLHFVSGKSLHLNGRHLTKVSVTMTDHGSMQDRVFLRGLIGALYGVKLTAVDPANQREAQKVNDAIAALQDGVTAILTLTGEPTDKFLHRYLPSCWWLSIDQLYFLCRRSADLRAALAPLGSITFGTGDIMTEVSHSARMGLLAKHRQP